MELYLLACSLIVLAIIAMLILTGVIAYVMWSKGSQDKAWRELASRTGLHFEKGGFLKRPSLHGVYQGRRVILDTHSHTASHKTGSGSYPYTRIRLSLENRADMKLVIREKRYMPPFVKATSGSGDPAVDLQFSIDSDPPEFGVTLFKSARLRQKILAAHSFDLEISGTQLHFEGRGVEKDVHYLIDLFNLVNEIAELVEKGAH